MFDSQIRKSVSLSMPPYSTILARLAYVNRFWLKRKKLTAGSVENINYRILPAQERLRSQALGQQLSMYRNGGLDKARFTAIDEQLLQDVQMLKEF